MTFIKHKLDANLQVVESGHAVIHNETLGLYEAINAPDFDNYMDVEDTDTAVAKLNADNYLGISTWRRPEQWEAMTQVKYVAKGPMADLDLYPDAKEAWYWTAQVVPYATSCVFAVDFGYGHVGSLYRSNEAFCRPVASVSPRQ